MKRIIIIIMSLFGLLVRSQETSFFVHAHQDDAIFFSNIPLFEKINNKNKVVCIVLTAGDQGAHDGIWSEDAGVGVSFPFYKARDYGFKKAVEFCYTYDNLPLNFVESTSNVLLNGKIVRKWIYGNVTIYFFDLPNGECCSLNMNGYVGNNYQSIEKLKKGNISTISNITSTTTYTWTELKNTIKSIFNIEKGVTSNVYSSDVNMNINPNDHADHYFTSVLALEAMDGILGFNSKLHIDYELDYKISNLSELDRLKKISTYGAMISGIATKGYRANRHIKNSNWLISEYIRDADAHYELMTLDSQLGGNPYTMSLDNIALNKPTYSLGDEPLSESYRANDGDLDTYWGNTPYSQWWKVDLGTAYKVTDFTVINFYKDSRYYKYKVYASTDNKTWVQVASKEDSSLSTIAGKTFTFSSSVVARYIRIDLIYNSKNQGVHISEFIAHGTPANIALNKPTYSSGDEPLSESYRANDGDLDTYWGNTPYSQWWKVDLGTAYKVTDFTVINFYKDSRYYKYKVYASTDNKTWVQVASKEDSSLSTIAGKTFTFSSSVVARYIRIDLIYNSKNQGVHISEFIAHGDVTSSVNKRIIEQNNLLNESNLHSKHVIYKNPIKIGEKLELSFSTNEDIKIIEINDYFGRTIYKGYFLKEKVIVDTSFFRKGIYIMSVNDMKNKIIFE